MNLDELLKSFQREHNILDIGYTEEPIPLTSHYYESWITEGLHGNLSYLEGERMQKRLDLRSYYPEFKSALVFLFSYQEAKKNQKETPLKMASYVEGFNGEDYHIYLREKLELILNSLKDIYPNIDGKYSLDTQPILERDMAYRSGLGWFGKNTMMISKSHGSYFIIGSLLLNQTLPMKVKDIETDHCGTCRRCIEACPTQAILENRKISASLCISNFTIELFKEEKAPEGYNSSNQIFGCDICQEVCPWNVKPIRNALEITKEETPLELFFLNRSVDEILLELENMGNREFKRKFKGTPLERTGRVGLIKNLKPFKSS